MRAPAPGPAPGLAASPREGGAPGGGWVHRRARLQPLSHAVALNRGVIMTTTHPAPEQS